MMCASNQASDAPEAAIIFVNNFCNFIEIVLLTSTEPVFVACLAGHSHRRCFYVLKVQALIIFLKPELTKEKLAIRSNSYVVMSNCLVREIDVVEEA